MCQIHTYISTHGTTKRGRDQSHKDDTGDDGHAAPPRKCPKILNDWTQAQPHIDKANRWRQRILAIEERFPTSSFPFRLMTTVIGGMAVVSAHTMYSYHVGGEHNFRSFVETVALDAMLNTYDQDHAPRDHAAAAGETPQATARPRGSPTDIPPSAAAVVGAAAHIAVSISAIEGWLGNSVQKCRACKGLTSYCCVACSDARGILPIHPPCHKHAGRIFSHPCMAEHKRLPSAHSLCAASATKSAAAQKAARKRKK